jgi:16S rRNA processing protein RimM
MTGLPGSQPQLQKRGADSSGQENELPRYIAIGRIVGAHGIRGEVSMVVLTEFPERFEVTEQVYLGNEFEATLYSVEGYRWHKKNLLLKLEGVIDRTQAGQLRNQFVQVPLEEVVPLPAGEYYLFQLIGLDVITTTGEKLGVMVDVLETGANDVYIIDGKSGQILLPAIADVIKSVDFEERHMIVELMDGLI